MTTTAIAHDLPAPQLDGPLVSTQWLADHLGSDNLVVLDASVLMTESHDGRHLFLTGHDQYLIDGHIPGAIFADLLDAFSDPAGSHGFTRPTPEQFAEAASRVGVDNDTTVIVYDTGIGTWAARLWWLFRSFGHDRIAVLDGGFGRWRAEQRTTDIGHIEPRDGIHFTAQQRDGYWATKHDVTRIVEGAETSTLVCAVPAREFTGEVQRRARAGHIPGSVNIPANRVVSRETGTFLDAGALHTVFADVVGAESIVTYCGGGIAATADALALTLLGHDNVRVYDGSLGEWAADENAPLTTTRPQ